MITRRCTQQLFLLRPDDATNQAFLYCLALAASLFNIGVLVSCAMSNHHHTVIYDRDGTYPQFIEYFHRLVARSQNVLRGRRENFWSSHQTSVVRLVDPIDVMRKIIYSAVNPVKDHLVERCADWPGVNTYGDLIAGRELTIERPKHFFRDAGPTPPRVTLRCEIPAALGVNSEAFLRELSGAVSAEEQRLLRQRQREGKRVLGARAICSQSWSSSPDKLAWERGRRPKRLVSTFRISPRVAARDPWSRLEALVRNQEFVDRYRKARSAWLDDKAVTFPPGTYWLKRFMRVAVETC